LRSFTTRQFRRLLAAVPPEIRRQAREAYRLFRSNPRHPSLQFKKVHPQQPIYSARISQDYRAAGVLKGDTIVWFFIGSHAEYDAMLRSL
jgi:hypothetical protein